MLFLECTPGRFPIPQGGTIHPWEHSMVLIILFFFKKKKGGMKLGGRHVGENLGVIGKGKQEINSAIFHHICV